MSDDTILKLGKLIEGDCGRDAIHIAVAPMFAAERLSPGQHVGLIGPDYAGRTVVPVGIVDPFLEAAVMKGDRFFLFLYPATITSLRHEWVHPAFALQTANAFSGGESAPVDQRAASERRLRAIADTTDFSYERMMETARENVRSGSEWPEYLTGGAGMESMSTPDDFWKHFEIVEGIKVPEDKKQNFFSCSC